MTQESHAAGVQTFSVGLASETRRTIVQADLDAFSAVSGDHNPLHRDSPEASASRFGGPIAHGMLLGSFISGIIGDSLPGPGTIYVSQSLVFRRAVKVGETVTTRVEVAAIGPRKGFLTLKTTCAVEGRLCLEGEAVVVTPGPEPSAS